MEEIWANTDAHERHSGGHVHHRDHRQIRHHYTDSKSDTCRAVGVAQAPSPDGFAISAVTAINAATAIAELLFLVDRHLPSEPIVIA